MITRFPFQDDPVITSNIIGGSIPDSQVVAIELSYSENKHDIATITYSGFPASAVTAYRGLPVTITLGNTTANVVVFNGYIAYIEIGAYSRMGAVNDSLIQEAKVVCFGTSYEMKPPRSAVYKNISLPKLVKKLATKYNFSYSVPNNSYVFPVIEQSNKSDWEVLVDTANKMGYYVTASNAHLNVYDPFSNYYRTPQPVILNSVEGDDGKSRVPGVIMEFKGTFGDITPDGNNYDYLLKTLTTNGKTIQNSSNASEYSGLGKQVPSRFVQEITIQANSINALKQLTNGYVKQSIPFHADLVISGMSNLRPGHIVKIEKYNSEFDGYWIIQDVKHVVNVENYLTYLHIKTDSTNAMPVSVKQGKTFVSPPNPVLQNNLWAAEKEFEYVY